MALGNLVLAAKLQKVWLNDCMSIEYTLIFVDRPRALLISHSASRSGISSLHKSLTPLISRFHYL
jgi:hypothetical protein